MIWYLPVRDILSESDSISVLNDCLLWELFKEVEQPPQPHGATQESK